jgi:hypothetical protein
MLLIVESVTGNSGFGATFIKRDRLGRQDCQVKNVTYFSTIPVAGQCPK